MYKRGVFFAFLFVFLLTSVSAEICSEPSQKIFGISSNTNAHGELGIQNNYDYEICYDNYFRGQGSGQRSENIVLRLSEETNAHAENPSSSNYAFPVMYQGLTCRLTTGLCNPSIGETGIIGLSSNTNAHLEFLGAGNYAYRLCCSSDLGHNPICNYNGICETSNGENSDNCEDCRASQIIFINYPEETIYAQNSVPDLEFNSKGFNSCEWFLDLTSQGEINCVDGNNLVDLSSSNAQQIGIHNITVYGKDSSGNKIKSDEVIFEVSDVSAGEITRVEWQNGFGERIDKSNARSTVKLYSETTATREVKFEIYERDLIGDDYIGTYDIPIRNGVASFDWFISDEVIELANDFGDCAVGGLEFYFIASVSNSEMESYELIVDCEEGKNTPPEAEISAPIHRQIYYINEPIIFNHTSKDKEGNIVKFNWKIVDAEGNLEYETDEESFIYTFTQPGQKIITLRVEDSKGAWDEDQIGILTINSPGILAYINNPSHQQIVPEGSGLNRLEILFKADDSYVLNAEGTCPEVVITCLAGNCPEETMNFPKGCDEKINVLNTPQPFGDLSFSWEFSDGQKFSKRGLVEGEKAFGKRSENLNDKKIILDLLYDKNNIRIGAMANREFTLGQCVGGDTFYELENGLIVNTLDTFTDAGACRGEDQLAGTRDDCCPANFACIEDKGIFLCRSPLDSPEFCIDYQEQSVCNEDPYNIAQNEPGWGDECEEGWSNQKSLPVECGCKWSTNDAVCKFNKKYIGGGGENELCTEYECLETYEKSECNNGYLQLKVTRELVNGNCDVPGDHTCKPEEEVLTVPCGRPTIELPFFGKGQFMAVIIAIALIYFIVRHKKGK